MKRLFYIFIIAIIIILIIFPKPSLYGDLQFSKAYFSSDNVLLRLTTTDDEKYRIFTPLHKISPQLVEATVLKEDKNFYYHFGVNPISVLRALYTNATSDRRIGASTITMQLARMRFGIKSNTISGKIQQMLRAIHLELFYSKDEILEAYLNMAPYGGNIEGIGAASLIFYHKKPEDLDLIQSINLAVIPQSPHRRNPIYNKDTNSRDELFNRWVQENPNDKIYQPMLKLPITAFSVKDLPFKAPHYVNFLENNNLCDDNYCQGTIDYQLHQAIENIVKSYVGRNKDKDISNAAALLLDADTMQIKSYIGSANFFNKQILGQNDGTNSKRSYGSTLKPFIYALAMEQGLIHPNSIVKDTHAHYAEYSPENADSNFSGVISAKKALKLSRNIPAITLAQQINQPDLYQFLQDANISELKARNHYGLAIVLGGAELTMQELVRLYAMLYNDGKLKDINFLSHKTNAENIEMLSPEIAFLTLEMLKNNPKDKSYLGILNDNIISYDKTGTSNGNRDAWNIGIFGNYVLAVWIGDFNPKSNDNLVGSTMARPLFNDIMRHVAYNNNLENIVAKKADSLKIKKVEICVDSGDINNNLCPNVISDWFIAGKSPFKDSGIYQKIPIYIDSGLRACRHIDGKTELQIYEFWNQEYLELFEKSGIKKTPPPAFANKCNNVEANLRITMPTDNVRYVLNNGQHKELALQAQSSIDEDIFWFANNNYLGKSRPNQIFKTKLNAGEYIIKATGKNGTSNEVRVFIEVNN